MQLAEADGTFALGDVNGQLWRKHCHRAGITLAINGLSQPHREYLEERGISHLLGDRGPAYAREKSSRPITISPSGMESLRLRRSEDLQSAYNSIRGPVVIFFGFRLHAARHVHFS